jgi:hypothetical protein
VTTDNNLEIVTFKPRTPAFRRPSRILELNAFSGTKPPQKPVGGIVNRQ